MKKLFFATAAAAMAVLAATARTVNIDLRGEQTPQRRGKVLLGASFAALPEGTLRRVNLAAGAADVGEVETGDILVFTLFDDVEIALTLGARMPAPLGGDVFIASADGCEGVSNAVVLRDDAGLTIDIRDWVNDRVYKVVSTASGVTVREMAPSHDWKCGCEESAAPVLSASRSRTGLILGTAPEQSDTCVDILVAYDRNAAEYANTAGGGTVNFAQMAVQNMNAALANTGLDEKFRFRLVGVTTVDEASADVHEALDAVTGAKAGWAAIQAKRTEVGADIVTTLIDTGTAIGTTGVGLSLNHPSMLTSFNAYNVCAIRSVETSTTMAHECGHNMGAGHSDVQTTEPGPQLYDYSAGCYFTAAGGAYCTIMAYGTENPSGMDTTEIPFFSSPSHTFMGVTVGDALHDNTRTLAETFSYAANWNAQVVPMSYDVTFSPAGGTTFDGTLAVTLAPGKTGTEIRYTLDGTDPTLSSPVYSAPIAVTSRTTIKAATVIGGAVSLPFSATYYPASDIGYAIGIAGLEWALDVPDGSSCGAQTTETMDGVGIGAAVAEGKTCKFSTVLQGPATISWYDIESGNILMDVAVDGAIVYHDEWSGYVGYWVEETADIPAGEHTVEFRLGSNGGVTEYKLDGFRLYLTPKPEISPSPAEPGTGVSFTGEQMVTLLAPNDSCKIYYTTDGSDPNDEGANLYDGPFFITESTKVRAVAVQPVRGASAVAEASFYENRAPGPGEWTMNGEAAYSQVQANGRMIAELCWNFPGCGWSAALEPVITDPSFTAWAELNGIYLLAGTWGDRPPATGSRFYNLYDQTTLKTELGNSTYYPTFVFAAAENVNTCLGALLVRNDGIHEANGIYYTGTVASLAQGFASFLGAPAPLTAPVPSVPDATLYPFPFDVSLVNNNGTGTMYYTLDGSAPTPSNGILYTGPVTISENGTILKAVVWPGGAGAVSGIPLVVDYTVPVTPSTPPPQVTGLVGSDGGYAYGALLRWSAAEGAVSYNIYRAETDDFASASLIGSTVQLRFWDVSVEPGKANYYFVSGVNANGEGAASTSATATRAFVYKVSFDPNGGGGAMAGVDVVEGDNLALPAVPFTKNGFYADGWATTPSGEVEYAAGANFVPTSDVVLYAHWEEIPFVFTDIAWTCQPDGSWRSATVAHNSSTRMHLYVTGSGKISFDWKTSCEASYDEVTFTIDGNYKAKASGTESGWLSREFTVSGNGSHDLAWTYAKDESYSDGEDCVWIRNVKWTPDTPVTPDPTPVTPDPTPVTPDPTPVTPDPTPVTPDPTPVTPDPTPVTPSPTPVTPVSGETPVLHTDEAIAWDSAFSASYAEQFCGFVANGSGIPVGTITVKAGKANNKTGVSKITATVILAGSTKKLAFKGNGTVGGEEFTATLSCAGQHDMTLKFGEESLSGTWGANRIHGSPNFFASKDKANVGMANAAAAPWKSSLNIAWPSDDGWNTLTVSIAAKGKVKASGSLSDGTKLSATTQLVVGEDWLAVPVVVNKKTQLAFVLWLGADGQTIALDGLGDGAKAGKPAGLGEGSRVSIDVAAAVGIIGSSAFADYLPDGVPVVQQGLKWAVPKAGKLAYVKGTTKIDEEKAGENPSALKLNFAYKTATFKGSFKAYALVNGRPKAINVKVAGVMIGSDAFGTATIKKDAFEFLVTNALQ